MGMSGISRWGLALVVKKAAVQPLLKIRQVDADTVLLNRREKIYIKGR
jgi:hypothetical protein